jgi:hypothetical protein
MPSKCKGDDCKKSASYGIVGGKRTHCASHKTEDMILKISETKKKKWVDKVLNKNPNIQLLSIDNEKKYYIFNLYTMGGRNITFNITELPPTYGELALHIKLLENTNNFYIIHNQKAINIGNIYDKFN